MKMNIALAQKPPRLSDYCNQYSLLTISKLSETTEMGFAWAHS